MHRSLKSLNGIIFLILFIAGNPLFGQRNIYNWEPDREWTAGITDSEEALIGIKNHVQYDYDYENGNLIYYQTVHKIFRANNDEAVQNVNRIYISMNGTIDIVDVKARTISKEGKVVELDENNIKEVKDNEEGNAFKIFAIEGAEVGGDIEYYYTKKSSASVFGREYFQFTYPSNNNSFRMTTPPNLKFDFKSYNGFAEVKQDTADLIKNVYEAASAYISPLREELFGSYNANRQRVELKLSYNTSSGTQRLFTWNDAAKRISELFYPFSNQEKNSISDLIKELKLKKLGSSIEQFAAFEHHVKTNFYIDDQAANADQIDFLITNKYGTEKGFARLFACLAEILGLDHELVMTSDRTITRFDGQFESWNYLSEYLIYLPATNQFMAPYHFPFRLGFWSPEFSATEGLFIKNQKFENQVVTTGSIKNIPELPYANNYNHMNIKVEFNDDLTENTIYVDRSSNGYEGAYIKAALARANEEQKVEILESVLEFLGPNEEFEDKKFEKDDLDYATWSDYILYRGNFTSQNFIERAGEIVLFSAGNLIGSQSELYQEKERTNLIENDYNRGYLRKIEVEIPEGYTIQNLDDLNMNFSAQDNGKVIYLFESSYELKGNTLHILIDEFYDQVYFPMERFEEFRTVVNAAADWNKIVLVLQPN